jgi:lipoprotein-anchoring transpeptidase ErfK/SrfK
MPEPRAATAHCWLGHHKTKTSTGQRDMSRPILSAAAALMLAVLPLASAEARGGAVHYDWGGSSEWGGGKQTVAISPSYKVGHIVVSFGDRRLYHVVRPGQAVSYPIAIPREQSRWEGVTNVSQKRENPSWTPTPTMLKENPRLPAWVPGGHPMNPLGVRALYLGSSTYRIHGTDAPWTIGQPVSKGCIRMFNEDVLDLYPKVSVGATVTVTWQRFGAGPGEAIARTRDRDEDRDAPRASRAQPDERKVTYRKLPKTAKASQKPKDEAPVQSAEISEATWAE